MNTKTLRIILGVLCIVAFLVAVFTSLVRISGVDLSLCELISLNKAGSAVGAGAVSGMAEGYKVILDGVIALVIVGFVASMILLLDSYLALISAIDKRFAGIAGIAASTAVSACVILAVLFVGKANAAALPMKFTSIGWGAIVLAVLSILILAASIWLLAAREQKRRARPVPSPVEPTRKEASPHAALTYRRSYSGSGYPAGSAYSDAGTAAADYGSVNVYRSAEAPKPSPEAAQRASSPVYVTGLEGTYAGARLDVSDGSTINFGRDASVCQVVFDKYDTLISRRHLSLKYVPEYDMFEARDMSRNGTFVDGLSKKLPTNEAQLLSRGTVLMIGSGKESFRLD